MSAAAEVARLKREVTALTKGTIYDRALRLLQEADDGGTTNANYVPLMESISTECLRRAGVARGMFDDDGPDPFPGLTGSDRSLAMIAARRTNPTLAAITDSAGKLIPLVAPRAPAFAVGQRVRMRRAIERFPSFIIHAGSLGTITWIGDDASIVWVKLDATIETSGPPIEGNECMWELPGDADVLGDDLEILTAPVSRFGDLITASFGVVARYENTGGGCMCWTWGVDGWCYAFGDPRIRVGEAIGVDVSDDAGAFETCLMPPDEWSDIRDGGIVVDEHGRALTEDEVAAWIFDAVTKHRVRSVEITSAVVAVLAQVEDLSRDDQIEALRRALDSVKS